MAHVNVLWAARLRAEQGEVRPIEALRASLASLPEGTTLRARVGAVEHAVTRGDAGRAVAALDRLLEVVESL
jgi:uncharacterized protein HemY